jgi:hypothetical protein
MGILKPSNIELRTRPESEPGRQYCERTDLPLSDIVMAVCSSDLLAGTPIHARIDSYRLIRAHQFKAFVLKPKFL